MTVRCYYYRRTPRTAEIRSNIWVFLMRLDWPTVGIGAARPGRPKHGGSLMTTYVAECSVTNCSFNDHSACNAAAITVGGTQDHASCSTFIGTGTHGGLPKVLAGVGACQRAECASTTAI